MKVWVSSLRWQAVRVLARQIQVADVDFAWALAPDEASVWIIDGTAVDAGADLSTHYVRLLHRPRVAYLVATPTATPPHPDWTLFTPPVDDGEVERWLGLACAAEQPWRNGLLRLRQWPNLARYGVHGRDGRLIAACMQLLAAPIGYQTLLADGVTAAALDTLLADAWASGLLAVNCADTALAEAVDSGVNTSIDAARRARLFDHIAVRSVAQ